MVSHARQTAPPGSDEEASAVRVTGKDAPRRRSGASPRYRTPALEKGLDILELLAARPDGLNQAGIARQLDRSVGEIFRMLNTLVERGYVAIERPGDLYVLTLKLLELAKMHSPTNRLASHAAPRMRHLAQVTNQSCHLTVVEGGRGIVVAQVDSPGDIGFAVRVGSEMDLVSTASGRVLLAFQAEGGRQRVLTRRAGENGIEVAELSALLQPIVDRGHEEMDSTRTRGVHDISFPVFDYRDAVVAAMTVPFIEMLDMDDTLDQTRDALREAARSLSVVLGSPSAREEEDVSGQPANGADEGAE